MKWRSLKSTIKQAVTRALVCPFGVLPNARLEIICHQQNNIFNTSQTFNYFWGRISRRLFGFNGRYIGKV